MKNFEKKFFSIVMSEANYNTMRKTLVKKVRGFQVLFGYGNDGYVVAVVPTLPGCHTQGRTLFDAQERVKEAISLYLEVASLRCVHAKS